MIYMKVIRVKAKVVPKTYTEEHLREVYQRRANVYGGEMERLRNDLTAAYQEIERLQAKLTAEKKQASEAYDLAIKASADLGVRLARTLDERDEAREEVDDLSAELMERECRINELERRIEWLLTHSDTGANFVS